MNHKFHCYTHFGVREVYVHIWNVCLRIYIYLFVRNYSYLYIPHTMPDVGCWDSGISLSPPKTENVLFGNNDNNSRSGAKQHHRIHMNISKRGWKFTPFRMQGIHNNINIANELIRGLEIVFKINTKHIFASHLNRAEDFISYFILLFILICNI